MKVDQELSDARRQEATDMIHRNLQPVIVQTERHGRRVVREVRPVARQHTATMERHSDHLIASAPDIL